ncbi:hypothetical protein Cni_G20204 [Canna indica]|uniref:DUF4408 domain-containing protein n=1 Tax=Canna indica TaxID=4628 RepID=A0AAQ3KM37_9LILI|nr:hypothetical protein Cni_G20204 [Canna indica]
MKSGEKLQAAETVRTRFLPLLIQFILRIVALGLFLSCPNWFPMLYTYLKFLFLVYHPNTTTTFLGHKCLFIISNIIIIFLVGDGRRKKQPNEPDVYEEYVKKSQSLERVACGDIKEKEEAEEKGLPVEELNRRVEYFIAKVNMQRKLEARTLISYGCK